MSIRKWNDYRWQLIYGAHQEPNVHMALDQQITEEVNLGIRLPTLRIWEWDSSAVVLGRFQSVKNEVNKLYADKYNLKIVRRITGGGAMFIEPGNTITYSLSIPKELILDLTFQESYKFLDSWVVDSFRELGVPVKYKPLNDIESENGKKIGGSAQARLSKAILHHTTIAYSIDQEKMAKVLRISKEKISDKGIESANKRVDNTTLTSTGLSRLEFIKNMINHFSKMCHVEKIELDKKTINLAKKISREKFSTESWINIVP
ncbi:MAG: lipoate--protein ligase family protein [Candidatus Kinetoplastibacterium crithidii]|nr:MAG: lipoate--protein ligase family protein [Candidatus Kinetoplastibacterium crithidii]